MIAPDIIERFNSWLLPPFDSDTVKEVKKLKKNPSELEEAFYNYLEFGTGGIRGIMGVGTYRINRYTLGRCTQGLSIYIKKSNPGRQIKSVVAYDCRNNSAEFAQEVASVFAANGVKCFLFSELRTTPELSFAVRHLKADCGIVITASHNPPEYNGFKVYGSDGAQITPPMDNHVIQAIEKVCYTEVMFDTDSHLVELIDNEIDQSYFRAVLEVAQILDSDKKDLRIIFTPLHGTSITAIPQVLELAGYKDVHIVEQQSKPDGNFPTVESPNPEEINALSMALKQAQQHDGDIVIGTDPDADRLGIGTRKLNGEWTILSGNQTMALFTEFLLEYHQKNQTLESNSFIASTIVSSPIMKKIADHYGVEFKLCLTGFKWIGKMISESPDKKFICGGEESFGFLVGDKVRDKDAVSATLLACEIAQILKNKGKSLYQSLIELYQKYGIFQESLVSLTKDGKDGALKIQAMMENLRKKPPISISNKSIIQIDDYLSGQSQNLLSSKATILNLPRSNVLIYFLDDESRIAIRPSGTEPKIKFYFSVQSPFDETESFDLQIHKLQQRIENLKSAFSL